MMEATEKLLRVSRRIYVHIDIDVLDLNEMEAIHMPVPDGLGLSECANALKAVSREDYAD